MHKEWYFKVTIEIKMKKKKISFIQSFLKDYSQYLEQLWEVNFASVCSDLKLLQTGNQIREIEMHSQYVHTEARLHKMNIENVKFFIPM